MLLAVLVSVFPQHKVCVFTTQPFSSAVTEKGPTQDSLRITNYYMVSPSTKGLVLPPMLNQFLSYIKHWLCIIVLHTS